MPVLLDVEGRESEGRVGVGGVSSGGAGFTSADLEGRTS